MSVVFAVVSDKAVSEQPLPFTTIGAISAEV
jgi:hypothetical protein